MSADRELLELAAKAADIRLEWVGASPVEIFSRWSGDPDDYPETDCGEWNPLTDDGDALRLAYKLSIGIAFNVVDGSPMAYREKQYGYVSCHEPPGNDGMAETRRAIVRAAAEIGRRMP